MKQLITCFLFAITVSASGQQSNALNNAATKKAVAGLKDIYLLRVRAKDFLQDKKFDSAGFYFSKVINNTIYANATDYMSLSYCRLQLSDTEAFKQHLIYSIEQGGADSSIIPLYFRPLDSNRHAYFKKVLASVFSMHRAIFLKKVDPAIEKEMKDIQYLDQICRRQEDMAYLQQLNTTGDSTNENYKHIKAIGRYIDSVNYERVATLIKRNKYPGFHNFGIASSNYSTILMHISDHDEEQWNFIFDFLKRQVVTGNMMPNEVVAIATRHYKQKKCTYYGTVKWGLSTPCDCGQVDKFRDEIGLDNLRQEYNRLELQLPDCYQE